MEEEVNENVKTKAPVMNKHLIMGLAMVIIVAVIIAVVALANKEKVVDYKEQIKELVAHEIKWTKRIWMEGKEAR